MGKKSKYPEYSSGSITVNGQTVSTTQRDKNNNIVSSNYNMSDTEKNIYDSVQNNIYSSLGNLFTITDEKQKQWNSQLDAIKSQGIEEINDIFTPMETNLKNDIASRFGNFDNSVFLDNLNEITDKKSKAVSDLSNNLLAIQDTLYNEELANRINTISFLNNLNSAMNNNILNFTNAAGSNANSGNNYNNSAYNANYNASNSWLNTLSGVTNAVTSVASAANPYYSAIRKTNK